MGIAPFNVGGHSKAYAENYDKIFRKKPAAEAVADAPLEEGGDQTSATSKKKSLGLFVIELEDGSSMTFHLDAAFWPGRKNVLEVRSSKKVAKSGGGEENPIWVVFELPCPAAKVRVEERARPALGSLDED